MNTNIEVLNARIRELETENKALKKTNAALETNKKILHTALEQSPSGIIIADAPDVNIILANKTALGIRGKSNDELTNIDVSLHSIQWKTFYLDNTPYEPENLPLSKAILKGETIENEKLKIKQDGVKDKIVAANAAPIKDNAGNTIAGIVIFHDITELEESKAKLVHQEEILSEKIEEKTTILKERNEEYLSLNEEYEAANEELKQSNEELNAINEKLEEEIKIRRLAEMELNEYKDHLTELIDNRTRLLKENNQKLNILLNNIPSILWCSTKEKSSYLSSNVTKLYGFTAEEILKDEIGFWKKQIHPDDYEFVSKKYQSIFETNKSLDIDFRVKHKEGHWVWINEKAEIVIDDNGIKLAYGISSDITEKKKAEEELKEEEIKYQTLFNGANDAIFLMQGDNYIDCNAKAETIFGCTKDDIIGETPITFSPKYQYDGIESKLKAEKLIKKAHKGESKIFEWKHKRLDGSEFDSEVSLKMFKINRKPFLLAILRDISEKKAYQIALKESEEKYRVLVNNSAFPVIVTKLAGEILFANDAAFDFFGKTQKTIHDFNVKDFWVNPEERKHFIKTLSTNGKVLDFEIHVKIANGEKRTVLTSSNVIQLNGEQVLYNIYNDVSERRKAELALKESEERYKLLSQLTSEGIVISFKGKIIDVNQQIENIYGYTPHEFKDLKFSDLVHPDDLDDVLNRIKNNSKERYEHRGIKKDGSILYLEITPDDIFINNQLHRLTIIRDITHRKLAEFALKESEEKFRNIFNNSSDTITITDFESNFIEVNDTVIEMLGYTKEEFLKFKTLDLASPSHHAILLERVKHFINYKNPKNAEIELLHKNGSYIPVEINGKVINYMGKPAALTIVRDISERKRLERKIFDIMIETEENERQRLAQDLHDDIGPLLSTLNLYIHGITEMEDEAKRDELIEKSKSIVKEAVSSVRQISNALSPHVLSNFGLKSAIETRIDKSKELIDIYFDVNFDTERFSSTIETIYYRIINELINNTIKHAGASQINISLHLSNNLLVLEYKDDGKGFNFEEMLHSKESGLGLKNILSRAQRIGGNYHTYDLKNGMGFFLSTSINKDFELIDVIE